MYSERLFVPLRWWAQTTMFLVLVWYGFLLTLPAWGTWLISLSLLAAAAAFFLYYGSARVVVDDTWLHAGPAQIERRWLGEVRALDAEATRAVMGVDADARAWLLTRPWLKCSVQVEITDPADPHPYWLISTRNPGRLAAALGAGDGDKVEADPEATEGV